MREGAAVSDSVSEYSDWEWESRAIPEPGLGPSSMEEWREGREEQRGREAEDETREWREVLRSAGGLCRSATCQTMM